MPRFARSDTVCGQCASVDGTNEATGRRNVSRISRTFVACTCGKERDYGPRLYSGSGLDDADSTAESQILDRFQGIVAHTQSARAKPLRVSSNVPLYARESLLPYERDEIY